MDMEIFAKRLKEVRTKQHVSAVELAQAIKTDTGTIHRWERAMFKSIKEAKLEAIADYLKVSKEYLIGNSDDKYDLSILKDFDKEQKIEINNVFYITKEILKNDNVTLEGKPVTEDNLDYILHTIDITLEILRRKNK